MFGLVKITAPGAVSSRRCARGSQKIPLEIIDGANLRGTPEDCTEPPGLLRESRP